MFRKIEAEAGHGMSGTDHCKSPPPWKGTMRWNDAVVMAARLLNRAEPHHFSSFQETEKPREAEERRKRKRIV